MRAYHYTNNEALRDILTGRQYRKGIIPIKRFIPFYWGKRLPDRARDGTIEALLEPEPESWTQSKEFPHLWNSLFCDICRKN